LAYASRKRVIPARKPTPAIPPFAPHPERKKPMADTFEQLKLKYQSVLNYMKSQNVQLQNLNMDGNKLFIRASAPSQDVKNKLWDQIKLVDPNFFRLDRRHSSSRGCSGRGRRGFCHHYGCPYVCG